MALRLDETAFERLLELLGPDRDRAAERYEEVRRNLVRFFEWRGCADPASLADEVMDRVARRLSDGEAIHAANPAGYFFGVARNVWRETFKTMQRHRTAATDVSKVASNPLEEIERETEAALACLEQCLGSLPPESRGLVLQYYQDQGIRRIERRRHLAEELAIEPGTFRLRMLRIRERLEACVSGCLDRREVTDEGRRPQLDGESTT